jgi:haloalkane dehalogenase
MVEAACATKPLDPAVVAAYDAPFPNDEYTAGSRIFPSLVPTNPTDPTAEANRAAWEVLKTWTKPLVTMFSDMDPVTAGGFKPFQKLVPGAQNQPHITIEGAGHFLQEDKGAQIAHLMNEFMAS